MAVHGWLLVQTDIGHARAVCDYLAAMEYPGTKIIQADTVTGPYDIIVHVEADDLDTLSSAAESAASGVAGIQDVITCLTIATD
jgi:uncharacterized protein with GYD domain